MTRVTGLHAGESLGKGDEKAPKVSVCIPSYNHARYIGKAIESVLSQTFTDWEVVVVDNCSPDNTLEVVHGFTDPRIRLYTNETNIGAVRNWNRCASLARGQYLAILQSDDQYLSAMLERTAQMLDDHPRVGLTHTGFHRIDSEGTYIDTKKRWDQDQVKEGRAVLRELTADGYITPSTVVMRRDLFTEEGGFDERYQYNIDWSMWMRIALVSDIGYVAEPLVLQRTGHPSSLTVTGLTRRPHLSTVEELQLIGEIFRRLPASAEWSEIQRRAYRNIMFRHTVKALWLLHHGEPSLFRHEIAWAIRLNHRFPIQYRKIMVLWAASALGGDFAKWSDFREQVFWQALRGEPKGPTVIVP